MKRQPAAAWFGSQVGFTLIELLIVVVIIGILAAVAIPKFSSTKEQSYVATMKTDLRNLVAAQEGYWSDNGGTYYAGAVPNAALTFQPSPGVTVAIVGGTSGGWAATATVPTTARTCAIFYGDHAPVAPAAASGVVACTL